MISFENWKQGFIITIAGQRLLWHTKKRPAIFVHRSGEIWSAWRGAGSCVPSMASKDSAFFAFSEGLSMREEFQRYGDHGSIFMLDFSSLDSKIDAVKIRFLDISSAKWNGLGPRPSHDLKGSIELKQGLQTAAFAIDGRFLLCESSGKRIFSFINGALELSLELPAAVYIGYAKNPMQACQLWHIWTMLYSHPVHWNETSLELEPQEGIGRFKPRDAVGLLGSLSFSGAKPSDFQELNFSIAKDAQGYEDWKIADLMLCQPDIVLPLLFRREIPMNLEVGSNRKRAQNRYAKIRAGLSQYWEFCEKRWNNEGIPAIFHPSILFPDDCDYAKSDNMLFSGSDLVFSPNMASKDEFCSLILPEGKWIHLWTSRIYPSGKVTVHAPFGTPALFYRLESEYAWLFDSIRQRASRL